MPIFVSKVGDMNSVFNVPSMIRFGGGCSSELPEVLQRLGIQKPILVTDSFLMENGVAPRFMELLKENGLQAACFSEVQPDPTAANVRDGLALYRKEKCDGVVAIGGGSPIDSAKAISVAVVNEEPLSSFMGYHKIPRAGVPLVVVPTTAGTGSEVTKVAVITDEERNVKMMMLDSHLLPTAALVDYELTLSMPKPLTAHVGVDTLTHGLEAYVSRKANSLTDPLALACIQKVASHLEKAWSHPQNTEARAGMMIAATLGGMAFANSSVCLVHGMSRPVGAYFHLPHGLSNAVLLPAVTQFSLPGATARYARAAQAMGCSPLESSDSEAAQALISELFDLNKRLEVPRLRDCLDNDRERFEAALPKMADDALASGSPQNNPVVPTREEIIEIYREAW